MMLIAIACVLLTISQLSASQTGRSSAWQTDDDWASSLQNPHNGINYVGDTEHSLHPSCHGPWTVAKEDNISGNVSCECGSSLKGLVQCDNSSFNLQLLPCFCMTPYVKDPNVTVVGACLYTCKYPHDRHYYHIPANDPISLSEFMCSKVARDGQLCGRCKDGFSPPAYSYDWHCLNCTLYDNHAKQIAIYITVAFVPLTVFFLIITTLHISATSPAINAFILVSQLTSAPFILRAYTHLFVKKHDNLYYTGRVNAVSFFASLYSIWNLDFFRNIYPPLCLHPSITTLQVLALDYIIAVYPLFLIVLTYIVVELHDHNFKFVVWLWKPFRRCFIRFKRRWNIKTSLIDAFGTFLLLSYVKFLSVSSDFLIPIRLHNASGDTIKESYLYYDATILYFGKQHLPYAILAITVLILFTILPILLLCLYPCQCFRKLLNCCKLGCTVLHTFMDTFQGCYKNRTNSKYDCRWFSAVYLIVRIAFHLLVAVTEDIKLLALCMTGVLIITALLIGVVQPYKSLVNNRLDMALLLNAAMCVLSTVLFNTARMEHHKFIAPTVVVVIICVLLPLAYVIAITVRGLLILKTVPQQIYNKVRKLLPCNRLARQRSLEELLVDPEERESLLEAPMGVDPDCDVTPVDQDTYPVFL